jgi:Protein tyrosine/serine phosphatase
MAYIPTTLPPSQVAATGTFADDLSIMVAKSNEDRVFDFYNVCSGLRFKVDRTDISKVTLIANGRKSSLAGSFSVDYSSDSPVIASVSEKFSSVTVSASAGSLEAGKWYYIMVLPSELDKGFTVCLEGKNGLKGLFFYEKPLKFNQSKFRQLTMTTRNGSAGNTWYFTPESCCIVNDREKAFIAAAKETYVGDQLDINSSNFYTTSIVTNYTGSGSSNQYPLPVDFTWTGSGRTLVYSTDPTFETSVSTSVTSSPCQIYNLIPGVEYYYKVLDSNGNVIKASSITPIGPLRALKLDGIKNFRDLGGWESTLYERADGSPKTIKYGKLYRGTQFGGNGGPGGGSGSNSNANKEAILKATGITVDIDLRGNGGGSPSNPFGFEQTSSLPHYKNLKVYQFMVKNGSFGETAELYRQALKLIISHLSNDEIIYFHCIGGADRTGTLAFLIEALLGVSETDLNIDYELTSFNDTRTRNNTHDGHDAPFNTFVQKMKETYAPSGNKNDIHTAVYNWATQDDDALTDEEINTLRELMLE